MAEATTRTSRWLFRTPESAGAIYGTIAAMAVIAGTAKEPEHGKTLTLTIATLLVFWWARAWAYTWASQNTNKVAIVRVSALPCSGSLAVPAITAMAAIVP